MRSAAVINANSLKSLERGILVLGTSAMIVSLFMLGTTGINYFQRVDAESKLGVTKQQIQSLTETISKSKRLKYLPPKEQELSVVQKNLDQYARAYDCQLTEVLSNNDEGGYMSRYKKGQGETGWKQFLVQFQIIGSVANTMSLLREVSSKEVPIEFQSVEIMPVEAQRFGHPQVMTKVTIQVMKQEGGR